MYREAVGERIRRLRAERGWSHGKLGVLSDRSRVTVLRLEKGEGDAKADLDSLNSIARAFDMSLGEFLWPVIVPEDAAMAEAAARESFEQERRAFNEALRRKYFSAMTDPAATQILTTVAQFVAEGKPEVVNFVADMIGRGAKLAMADQLLDSLERYQPGE